MKIMKFYIYIYIYIYILLYKNNKLYINYYCASALTLLIGVQCGVCNFYLNQKYQKFFEKN